MMFNVDKQVQDEYIDLLNSNDYKNSKVHAQL